MEVLIGGAIVGAAAWLAKKLSRLRHRKRNRRFLAQAGALEDAYGQGEGGVQADGAGHQLSRLQDRDGYGQPSPALIQAGIGVGAMDHPAHYAAVAAASDVAIANGRADRLRAAQFPGWHEQEQYGYDGQDYHPSGPIIEEIGTAPWQEHAYGGRPSYPALHAVHYSRRSGQAQLTDGVHV